MKLYKQLSILLLLCSGGSETSSSCYLNVDTHVLIVLCDRCWKKNFHMYSLLYGHPHKQAPPFYSGSYFRVSIFQYATMTGPNSKIEKI